MKWCLAYTEAQREAVVQDALQNETYLPRIRERGGKISTMFPNYLFVRLIDGQFYNLRKTPHVIRVILDPGSELDEAVVNLRRREREGYVRLPRVPTLQKGSPVKIIGGSFEGAVGWYDGQTTHDRVRVLLEMIGRKVPVELSERQIARYPHKMLR